jgi:hypothetical protein
MRNIEQIKRDHRAIGGHWFDPDSMKFFRTRLFEPTRLTDEGELFISSDSNGSDPRAYTVRLARPTGEIQTASGFMYYGTKRRTERAILSGAYGGEDLLTRYRWIMYLNHPMSGFEVERMESLEGAKDALHHYQVATGMNDSDASLYPYTAEDWAEAREYEEIGCPFDYPSYIVENGPRGGIKVVRA